MIHYKTIYLFNILLYFARPCNSFTIFYILYLYIISFTIVISFIAMHFIFFAIFTW